MKRLAWLFFFVAACSNTPDPRIDFDKPPAEISVGQRPIDVVLGKLDGDDKLDLVSANAGDSTLSVRLQRDGAWVAAAELQVDTTLHLLALGDVDRDGDLDLLSTTHDSASVWMWLGDGAGGFVPAPGSPFAALAADKPHNHGLAVADLDGDGDADVVVADQTAKLVAVLLADGTGRLAAGGTFDLGGQPYPPAIGDVDGDGKLDLVAPLLDRQGLAILRGDGNGSFVAAPGSPLRLQRARPYAVSLADLDGDRALDIVAPHDDTSEISVLLNDGKGNFRAAPSSPISAGRRLWRTSVADVDGDGVSDLVGAGGGSLVVMRGDGRGGFAAPHVEQSGGWVALAADVDGDRRVDLITPEPSANVIRAWLSTR